MGLVAIGSAKAAPGVTTLTVALAALTPGRTVAADLDPEGGDLALRYRSPDGGPLDPEVGLLSLAASLRGDQTSSGRPTAGFRSAPVVGEPADDQGPVPAHLQTSAGGLDLLLGVSGPDQAVGLGPLWTPLARALADTSATVFADCGRVGAASPALPVLRQADAVILLARAEMEELAHLRERLRFLIGALAGRYPGPTRLGVVLVAAERDRAAGPRTEQLLRASGLPVPVLGTIADDPRGAARLRGVGNGRAERSTLIRSVRSLVPQVVALAGLASTTSAAVSPPPVSPPTAAPTPATGFGAPVLPPFGPPPLIEEPVVDDAPHLERGRPADAGDHDERPAPGEPPVATSPNGERWREVDTPPGGTGWPGDPQTRAVGAGPGKRRT